MQLLQENKAACLASYWVAGIAFSVNCFGLIYAVHVGKAITMQMTQGRPLPVMTEVLYESSWILWAGAFSPILIGAVLHFFRVHCSFIQVCTTILISMLTLSWMVYITAFLMSIYMPISKI